MGSSYSYSSSSKGGSSTKSSSENKKSSVYLPIKQVISLLEELGERQQDVMTAQKNLDKAVEKMRATEKKVQQKMATLDPTTRELLQGMMSQFGGKTVPEVGTIGGPKK